MNMMRKNNIIKKDRHILRNLKDDDAMLFCFYFVERMEAMDVYL
jgi:hypothetical protein